MKARSLRDEAALAVLPSVIARSTKLDPVVVVAEAFALADQFMLRRAMVKEEDRYIPERILPKAPSAPRLVAPVERAASIGCLDAKTHKWGPGGRCSRCDAVPDTPDLRDACRRALKRLELRRAS